MDQLATGFESMHNKTITFERLRNNIRQQLHQEDGDSFPYGFRGTSIYDLANTMFSDQNNNASSQCKCSSCEWEGEAVDDQLSIIGYHAYQQPESVTGTLPIWFMPEFLF